MRNGKDVINELEYREHIRAMGTRELLEYTAVQAYETRLVVADHENRLCRQEKRDRKWVGVGSGVGAMVSAILYAIFHFTRNG